MTSVPRLVPTFLIVGGAIATLVAAQYSFVTVGGGQYVSSQVMILQYLAFALILAMAYFWRQSGNLFLLLLTLVFCVFYFSRPLTLMYFPFSAVLTRHDTGADDFFTGYLVSIVGVACLFAGLGLATRFAPYASSVSSTRRIGWPVAVVIVGIMGLFLLSHYVSVGCEVPALLHYGQLFVDPNLSAVLVLYLLYRLDAPIRQKAVAFFIFLMVYLAARALVGSRSGAYSLLYAALLIYGAFGVSAFQYLMPRKAALLLVAPIVVVVTLFSFSAGDYFRTYAINSCSTVVEEASVATPVAAPATSILVLPFAKMAERLGGVDNTVDLVANSEAYSGIISWSYYLRSILDGVFVGSVTGEEAIRASILLKTAYNPASIATVRNSDAYQSDLITPYAELIILMGWPGLILGGILLGFVAGKVWTWSMRDIDQLPRLSLLLFAAVLWWSMLNSYGIDWVVVDGMRQGLLLAGSMVALGIFERVARGIQKSEMKTGTANSDADGPDQTA